jgi:hypothetical protein
MSNVLKGTIATDGTMKGNLATVFAKDGEDGTNGKSAYEIALDNGFEGTEAEWLESLKGEDGKDGKSGVYVGSGEMPEDCNVQIDPDGQPLSNVIGFETLNGEIGELDEGIIYNFESEDTNYPFTSAIVAGVWENDYSKQTQFAFASNGKIYSRVVENNAFGFAFGDWEVIEGSGGSGGDAVDEVAREQLDSIIGTRTISKNLFTDGVLETGFLQSNGTLATNGSWASYATSDFIPVKPSTYYTFSVYLPSGSFGSTFRVGVMLFDANKNPITSTYTMQTTGTVTVKHENAYFIRCSYTTIGLGVKVLEEAESRTGSTDPYESITTLRDLKEVIATKEGGILKITSKIGNETITHRINLKNTNRNGLVNFERCIVGSLTQPVEDEVTPFRFDGLGTVGANHGHTIPLLTLNGQTTSDIGSVWTDGTRQFVLVKLNGNGKGYFAPMYVERNGRFVHNSLSPVADLTHESGATHTGSVSISGMTRTQMLPSVNNAKIGVYANEWEITEDGITTAEKITIKEEYNIISYKSLVDYAMSHVGAEVDIEALDGLVKITNHYHFTAGGKCVVNTSITALENVLLGNTGIVQSAPLLMSGTTLYRYLNGVKAINGIDFKSNIDMTSYNTNTDVKMSDSISADNPPNRSVDTLYMGDKKVATFTMGYFPDKTKAKDENRKSLSYVWDMRGTKKCYPIAISNATMNVGECLSFSAYRCYNDPECSVTNCNAVELGNVPYVFIDSHTVGTHKCKIGDKYVGRSIKVVSSEGITFNSDVVDSEGLVFTSESYGTAVITLT